MDNNIEKIIKEKKVYLTKNLNRCQVEKVERKRNTVWMVILKLVVIYSLILILTNALRIFVKHYL